MHKISIWNWRRNKAHQITNRHDFDGNSSSEGVISSARHSTVLSKRSGNGDYVLNATGERRAAPKNQPARTRRIKSPHADGGQTWQWLCDAGYKVVVMLNLNNIWICGRKSEGMGRIWREKREDFHFSAMSPNFHSDFHSLLHFWGSPARMLGCSRVFGGGESWRKRVHGWN